MSLLSAISKIQSQVIFNPKFHGIPATYSRRVVDAEGEYVTRLSTRLYVSPQGNFATTDRGVNPVESRVKVIWAKTRDLVFDGEPFVPQHGDEISYRVDGQEQTYSVSAMPSLPCFTYEDAMHEIIKIETVLKS